jgi:hypothetical protein
MRQPPPDNNGNHLPLRQLRYLLTEMEAAIERSPIQWDEESAVSAQEGLNRLSAILRRIAADVGKH